MSLFGYLYRRHSSARWVLYRQAHNVIIIIIVVVVIIIIIVVVIIKKILLSLFYF